MKTTSIWRQPKNEDDLKLKKNWFWRLYPARAYTTLVVLVSVRPTVHPLYFHLHIQIFLELLVYSPLKLQGSEVSKCLITSVYQHSSFVCISLTLSGTLITEHAHLYQDYRLNRWIFGFFLKKHLHTYYSSQFSPSLLFIWSHERWYWILYVSNICSVGESCFLWKVLRPYSSWYVFLTLSAA